MADKGRDDEPTGRPFDVVYAEAADRLVTQLYLVTGDVEEARDCVQEAFARAWLRWDTLGLSPSPLAWIYTVGYRIAVSRFRRAMVHRRAVRRLADDGAQSDLAGPSADAIAVRGALAQLPHGQRAALVLHYYEGKTVDDIAQLLGVSTGTVKSRLSRGRAALHPLLDDRPTPAPEVSAHPGSPS
jgi:RNA polymerase sigma-70 factor (ECF subfamily)